MNKIITVALLLVGIYCHSQVNRYDSPATSPSGSFQPYTLDYDKLNNALQKRQDEYDNAKSFADGLYELISNLSKKETDKKFKEDITGIKSDLDILYVGDLSRSTTKLSSIKNRIEFAISEYNDRLKTNQNTADNSKHLRMLMQTKAYQEALNYINNNLINQQNVNQNYAYLMRGDCLMAMLKYKAAVDDYTRVMSNLSVSSDEYLEILERRIWANLYGGNIDDGFSDSKLLVKLKPRNAEGYFALGYALNEQKKYGDAITQYDEAIKMNPNHSMAYNNRGYIKFGTGLNINEALRDIDKSIGLDSENASALSSRAEINIQLEKYTEAIIDLNKAIALRESGLDYYLRGNAKIKLHDKIGACSDWSKAGDFNEMRGYNQISIYCK